MRPKTARSMRFGLVKISHVSDSARTELRGGRGPAGSLSRMLSGGAEESRLLRPGPGLKKIPKKIAADSAPLV